MVSQLLPLVAALSLGLLAGALLAEDRLLLPYFRTLSAETFFALHPMFGPMLFRFFAPLTIVPPVATVLAAVQTIRMSGTFAPASLAAVAAAMLTCGLLAIYQLFFKSANAAFERRTVPDTDLPAALTRWAAWHRARVLVCLAAFGLSLVALAT